MYQVTYGVCCLEILAVLVQIFFDTSRYVASCTVGTESFPGLKCGRGVQLTTHTLLVPRS